MAAAKPTLAGSFPIARIAGIRVYLHWSWLLVGYLELQFRTSSYANQAWNVAEYLSLFFIVLLHEFGHALACRQVGGRADEIVLWPLGGIAYVNPPPRPGPWLWSIAAGPLVNVLLAPLTVGAFVFSRTQELNVAQPDVDHFLFSVMLMNLGLLIFNILPIYPLDGGQIVYALLWFVIGRASSLMVVSVVGLLGAAAIVGLALLLQDWWFGLIALFVALRCWGGFQQARMLARVAQAKPRFDAACPACQAHPPIGDFWVCAQCLTPFDAFEYQAQCPRCGKVASTTSCPDCYRATPMADWYERVLDPNTDDDRAPEAV